MFYARLWRAAPKYEGIWPQSSARARQASRTRNEHQATSNDNQKHLVSSLLCGIKPRFSYGAYLLCPLFFCVFGAKMGTFFQNFRGFLMESRTCAKKIVNTVKTWLLVSVWTAQNELFSANFLERKKIDFSCWGVTILSVSRSCGDDSWGGVIPQQSQKHPPRASPGLRSSSNIIIIRFNYQ